jgi:exo-1,4-beta-D-glucosaminidase
MSCFTTGPATVVAVITFWASLASSAEFMGRILLNEDWQLQSSAKIPVGGEAISTARFKATDWHPATVPSTVVGCLVEAGMYPDPFFGTNLLAIPSTVWPRGSRTNAGDNPFSVSWWYRKEFRATAPRDGRVWLNFDAINYSANVWVNGRLVADTNQVAGAYRMYEFDITDLVQRAQPSVVAVEVFPPQPDNLALNWVDWNPTPPDKNMGLWRDVAVVTTGPVALRYPQITTKLDGPANDRARLTISAELRNPGDRPVQATLRGTIERIEFKQTVELAAHETRSVTFSPDEFPQLIIQNPRLWWPVHFGTQNLHDLNLQVEVGGKGSDQERIRFGIREAASELNAQGHRVFKINGRPILIRGGGWAPDMFLRPSAERELQEIRYVKDMNLNTIRFEGRAESRRFLELCDREGILVIAGWCCCDCWEQTVKWQDPNYDIAAASLRDQLRRLRNHPALLTFWYGSDVPPNARAESNYLAVFKEVNWPNSVQSSATAKPSPLGPPTGLRMPGPYDYVPPMFWYADTNTGGIKPTFSSGQPLPASYWPRVAASAGFNTETSPGPAVPPIESLRRMLPAENLWPIDSVWNFHTGGGPFVNIGLFTEALNKRLGEATSADEFARKAQLLCYDGQRAMFEVYGRNKYDSTGVIQWMMNNAWPSLIWHLYDYYLRPGGGYFGTKKACEPLHIQYSYDDRSVVVVNGFLQEFKGLNAKANLYNLDLAEKFSRAETLDIGPDGSKRVFVLPEPEQLTSTYFVKLTLSDSTGKNVSENFYWLSTRPDTLGQPKDATFWFTTPTKEFADFTALNSLPPAAVKLAAKSERKGRELVTRVVAENPGKTLAFFLRLKLNRARDGEEVLPVIWEDNYISLLPGEKRELAVTCAASDLHGDKPVVELSGWNVTPTNVSARR